VIVTGLVFDLPQGRWMDEVTRLRSRESSAYYLSPADDIGFHDFQRRLANCGLRFEPSPYEYVPHCTIAILAADAAAEAHAEVRAFPVPSDNIRVSSVSFWSVDQSHQVAQQGQRIALGA